MRRDRRKDLYRTERDSLEGPHEEAEIQQGWGESAALVEGPDCTVEVYRSEESKEEFTVLRQRGQLQE